MNTDKIKFAILGCGHIGKRHAEMIIENESCELVALCDKRPNHEITGVENVPYFMGVESLFSAKINFDVLCIATPNGLHEQHALLGIKNGAHIVIEKPMALTKTGCERIIFEALHYHRHIFCVMQNRYSPPVTWLKEIISKGLLGEIGLIQINCYWNRDNRYYVKDSWHGTLELDGGPLFTQFSHFVDLMYWMFGDIKNINARFLNFNHNNSIEFEDSGLVNFDFVNGGAGSFNYSVSAWKENFETSITILAENGSVKIGGQYMNTVEYCKIKDYKMPDLPMPNNPNDYGAYKGSASNHSYIFQNVVDVLNGRGAITTNALEGMKVIEIIERIYSLRRI